MVSPDEVTSTGSQDTPSQSILAYLQSIDNDRTIPPLEQWNPQVCGDMDLTIRANGEWWHEGRKIQRQSMINLFARVLWKEDGQYYFKTPVEKIRIQVEDVPLLVTQVDQVDIAGQPYLQLTTQNGDVVIADAAHPVGMRPFEHDGITEYRPYVRVRQELDALIDRQSFYHLVAMGQLDEQDGQTFLTLTSGDQRFVLAMPSALAAG